MDWLNSSISTMPVVFAIGAGKRDNSAPLRDFPVQPRCRMNFHEYQAKQLFADYGITVPKGIVARTPDEAVAAAKLIPAQVEVSDVAIITEHCLDACRP